MVTRVGIVGLGYWGPNLVKNFFQIEQCEVAYCCDTDKKQLDIIKKHFPSIIVTQNIQTLLTDPLVDAIVIATPSNTHFQLVRDVLTHGKHVFVEKPFTLSTKDAIKLIELNKKAKRVILVGHTYEYHPAILKIKEYIQQGLLGDIYYIYCSRVNLGKIREETNALWNLAPHDISILQFFLEKEPKSISAFGQAYLQNEHEDVVFINLKYPGGVIAHIHVSWLDPRKERKITLIGSKKMVVFDDMDNEASIKIYDKGVVKLVNNKGERIFGEFSLKLRPGDIHLPYVEPKEPLREECMHFIECIQKGISPQSSGENGEKVVQILEIAQKSLNAGGKWINLS